MYECKKSERYDTADVPTYEEVVPYCRAHGAKHRLVALLGKCCYATVRVYNKTSPRRHQLHNLYTNIFRTKHFFLISLEIV